MFNVTSFLLLGPQLLICVLRSRGKEMEDNCEVQLALFPFTCIKSEVCLSAGSVLRTRGKHNLLSELRTVAAGIVSSTAKKKIK